MDSRIPESVQHVLNDYVSLCQQHLPETLEGLYVHGSVALGAYQEGSSDIDFMAMVNRSLGDAEMQAITLIHQEVKQKQKIELDGSYLLAKEAGRNWNDVSECIYVNGGKAKRSKHEMNPVTWWMMKNKGIRVIGPDISSFHIEVQNSDLTSIVLRNMNIYWAGRINTLRKYKRIAVFLPNQLIRQEMLWSVPGVLRAFYTLQEQAVTSKAEVCTYALDHVPERWHPLIHEVISMREGEGTGFYKSKKQKIEDVLQLMVYIIAYCNETYKE
ncbi:hypothetical protein HNO89_003591 [Sporosarcina luteola]|nr:hypothetical protein [Sporosarcina luteola]